MTRHGSRGFTLIEVLAAMALLALLLTGVYAGVRTAIDVSRSGTRFIEREGQVAIAQQFLRRELTQAMPVVLGRSQAGLPIVFAGSPREMRYIAPLPGYLGTLGPQWQRVALVDDGSGGLRLEATLALAPPDGQAPRPLDVPQVLVDHIATGSFQYAQGGAPDGRTAWATSWRDGRQLPGLVRITLRLRDGAGWPELVIPVRLAAPAAAAATNAGRAP